MRHGTRSGTLRTFAGEIVRSGPDPRCAVPLCPGPVGPARRVGQGHKMNAPHNKHNPNEPSHVPSGRVCVVAGRVVCVVRLVRVVPRPPAISITPHSDGTYTLCTTGAKVR